MVPVAQFLGPVWIPVICILIEGLQVLILAELIETRGLQSELKLVCLLHTKAHS